MSTELGFATRAIHDGQDPKKWTHRAVVPPISMSTTFQKPVPLAKNLGFTYSRIGNPTRQCLEESLASLEHAKYALCFASGLGATVSISHLLKAGDHMVCCDEAYGGTNMYFKNIASERGIEVTFADLTDPNVLKTVMKNNTKMVWIETPSNPTMKIIDLAAVSKILKEEYPNAFSVVDNTFMSSFFQTPLKFGIDVVMHSLTKYMNGHDDSVMGAAATNNEDIYSKLSVLQYSLGCVPSPFDCFLVNRGLKTLHVRMQRHMENATIVAKTLECHPAVEKVLYPGLLSHPQHALVKKQCSGYSGMVSFYIKGGLEASETFVSSLKVILAAASLGGTESLVSIPIHLSHVDMPVDQRERLGITENLIRLSIGLESQQDLIKDIEQALAKAIQNHSAKKSCFSQHLCQTAQASFVKTLLD